MRHGDAANSDVKVARNFIGIFKKLVNSEVSQTQKVLNCDETFLKKDAKRTYVTAEENALLTTSQ